MERLSIPEKECSSSSSKSSDSNRIFREIDIPRPPNEPLIRPDQRIRVNLFALMSPDSESLSQRHDVISLIVQLQLYRSINLHGELIKPLSSYVPHELSKMVQHTGVHHISGETLRVLGQAKIWQPFGAHPGVTELSDTGISNVTRMSMFLDSQTQFLSMKRHIVDHTAASREPPLTRLKRSGLAIAPWARRLLLGANEVSRRNPLQ